MRLAVVALAAIAMGVSACGALPGNSYTIHIDPSFSPEDQAAIVSAADTWSANVPVYFTITYDTCEYLHDGHICVLPIDTGCPSSEVGCTYVRRGLSDMPGDTAGFGGQDGGIIWVSADTVDDTAKQHGLTRPEVIQKAMKHELGHAMGLVHHDTIGVVMGPYFNDIPAGIACDDVYQWYGVRGMDWTCQ